MYYYINFVSDDNDVSRYTFCVETYKQKGWVEMRLVAIERTGKIQSFTQYDENTTYPRGHYMYSPYKGRIVWSNNKTDFTYRVKGLCGDEYIFITTPSQTILRL
jgi:hypothetical protein